MTLNQALKEDAPAGATETGGVQGIAQRLSGGVVRRKFPTGVINIAKPIKKKKKKKKKKIRGVVSVDQSDVVKGSASFEGISVGSDKMANVGSKGNEEFISGTRTKQKKRPSEISGKERRKLKRVTKTYRDYQLGNVGDYNKYV